MAGPRGSSIAIAGAGIAGLTAALAFAARGFAVTLFERAPALEEAGAGLQLSPNATRILGGLGVLEALGPRGMRPEAIALKSAGRLATLARMPLGRMAEARWGAPYLVAHRGDLQAALVGRVAAEPRITLVTGAGIDGAAFGQEGVRLSPVRDGSAGPYRLLVGADGVRSSLRPLAGARPSRFSGHVAWRAMLRAQDIEVAGLGAAMRGDEVTALLSPHFHLVAYPLREGRAINLVAVTRGEAPPANGWSMEADAAPLVAAMKSAHPALSRLAGTTSWTAWPILVADMEGAWTHAGGLALIGDAAHAMTPFAAQGAAMGIEDAAVLAGLVSRSPEAIAVALARYEKARRPRVRRVAGRGAFNRFVWHAGGPAALARDMVLKARPPRSLLRDFDWLYRWRGE